MFPVYIHQCHAIINPSTKGNRPWPEHQVVNMSKVRRIIRGEIVRGKGCAKCNGRKWALICRCIFNCGKRGCKGN